MRLVWHFLHDLWGHVSWCSTVVTDDSAERSSLDTEPKIDDFYTVIFIDQYVFQLDIAMSVAKALQKDEPIDYLLENVFNFYF